MVEKINAHLPSQIRVWGIERTIGSFSCYQACDSRWYEYLIPTHCLLPPHPTSFLARQLEKAADEVDDRRGYEERQAEVADFWQSVENTDIRPILDSMDEETRSQVIEALYRSEDYFMANPEGENVHDVAGPKSSERELDHIGEAKPSVLNTATSIVHEQSLPDEEVIPEPAKDRGHAELSEPGLTVIASKPETISEPTNESSISNNNNESTPHSSNITKPPNYRLITATKRLRTAYLTAKRRWRISSPRIARLQTALSAYEGTHNFYNYTIQKTGRDPSAKRHIKSFEVNHQPILKRVRGSRPGEGMQEGDEGDDEGEETEWLSLKVHGQSFMMHQIRKMVGMAVLAVRCGADVVPLIQQSYDAHTKFSIPKAPGLGLLLERPVFESYNKKVDDKFKERAPIGFEKYKREMDEFKNKEIYGRVFGEEQREGVFHSFFGHVDNYREPYFLFVTSKGVEATKGAKYGGLGKDRDGKLVVGVESEDEDEIETEGAGGEGREG